MITHFRTSQPKDPKSHLQMLAAAVKQATIQNKLGQMEYFSRVSAGCGGGSENIQQAMRP